MRLGANGAGVMRWWFPALAACIIAEAATGAGPRYARWDWLAPAALPYLQEAGITHVLVSPPVPPGFAAACEKAGIAIVTALAPPGVDLLTGGKWPGLDPMIQTGPGGEKATSGATGEPWIDSNGWLVLYHGAVKPGPGKPGRGPLLLAYDPPAQARLRPGSVELAIADAAMFGAQFVVRLDERLRRGLESGQPRAVAEWKRVARQLAFVETPPFRGTPAANIAVLAAAPQPAGEVLNLLLRRNLPAIAVAAAGAQPAALENFAMVIALGVPAPPLRKPIVVQRDAVPDPHAFALEMRKLLGKRALYRLENGETLIGYPRRMEGRMEGRMEDGRLALHLVNYAIDTVRDVRVFLNAKFTRAQLLAPERDAPLDLPIKPGQKETEFAIPEIRVSAVVVLE